MKIKFYFFILFLYCVAFPRTILVNDPIITFKFNFIDSSAVQDSIEKELFTKSFSRKIEHHIFNVIINNNITNHFETTKTLKNLGH